ncbi:MAG TPA: hypothetical protein VFV75_12285 [Candidatus Polarisedimenticolaceae bacterium]|nr:hypothetical protein [Candidatus Polarisedimenticolaceae bacterium]
MNVGQVGRGALAIVVAALVVSELEGCGQQLGSSEKAASPQAEARQAEPTPAPRSVRVTVPEGTEVHMTLSSSVGSATSQVGEAISGTTTSAVVVGDRVAIPAGSTIHGRVSGVDPASKGLKIAEKGGGIALSFTGLTTPSGERSVMSGSLTSVGKSKGKTAGIIGGSAAGGAILGKVLGGSTKDAAIGAILGGGIGTGIAAGTKGKEVVIPAGTALAITLDKPLTITRRS